MHKKDMGRNFKTLDFARFSTLQMKGKCVFHAYHHLKEMEHIFHTTFPLYFYGGGSKLLLPEEKVVHFLCDKHQLFYETDHFLYLSSGVPLAKVTQFLVSHDLEGAYLTGIPGTIGGAVRGNAGTKEGSISRLVEVVLTYDGKNYHRYFSFQLHYGNRQSILKYRAEWIYLVVLRKIADSNAKRKQKEVLQGRSRQPKLATLGSTFINTQDLPSGKILQMLDVKGLQYGGYEIAREHANFIVKKNPEIVASNLRYFIELLMELFYNYLGTMPRIEIQEASKAQWKKKKKLH